MTAAGAYSWYEDDELLSLLDRHIGRAPDSVGAGRRVKAWLARSDRPADAAPSAPEAPVGPADSQGAIWLTREQAAAKIGISRKTLANYGEAGPPYESWPFVRYRLDLLDAWLERRKRTPSRRGRPRRT